MLFTKKQIQGLIDQGKNLKFFEEYMGFKDIGQGYGYKSVEAWNSDKLDVIVYIPEHCSNISYSKSIKHINLEIDSCYTKQDFINITGDLKKS